MEHIDVMQYPEGFDALLDEVGKSSMPEDVKKSTLLSFLIALLVD